MDNPYLKELDAFIIDKKKKDNTYHIKLDKTIFYPHLSGGQPGDQGTINGIEVLKSYEENDDIIHILKEDIDENKVQISIDFDNRLDMMQQHTGQHLLSSCFYRLFNAHTIGFHVGHDYVTIDITMNELTGEDVEKIEIMANKIIWSNFNVKSYFPSQQKLKKLPLRKMPTVTKNIRIVEIDGFDYSPCGGTHLRSTGELGIIKIRKWEKYKGHIRVEFLCGNRALKDYIWKNKYIKDLSLMLSSSDKDLITKVKKLYDDKNALEKQTRELREDLNKIKAEEFLKSATLNGELNFIVKILEDTNLLEVSFISSYLNNNNKNLVQIYGLKNQDKGQFYITKTKDVNINLLDTFKAVSSKFNIKGGGNPNSIQGAIELDDIENVTNLFYEEFVNELKVRE